MGNFSDNFGKGFFGQSYGQWTLFFVFWIVVWGMIHSGQQILSGRRG